MKKIFAAVALSIALPAIAHAQSAPAPAKVEARKDCCAEMKTKMDCCKDMGGGDAHAGHDMKPTAKAPHAQH